VCFFLKIGELGRFFHRTQIQISKFFIPFMVPFILLLTWDWYSLPIAIFFSYCTNKNPIKRSMAITRETKKEGYKKAKKHTTCRNTKKGKS